MGDNVVSLSSKLKALAYLFITWSTALPRIVYRTTFSLIWDPKGTQIFINQILNSQDIDSADPVLGCFNITEMLPGEAETKIVGHYCLGKTGGTHQLIELSSLVYLTAVLKPRIIFEMGTFLGQTTRLLALNSPPTSQIVTLDLPRDRVTFNVGEAYRGTPEERKILQLYGDSLTFDFSPWNGQCDFVWVDACHDYPYVVQDSQTALKLCRPGGWIGWHDYRHTAWWSGVTRAVRKLAKVNPGIRHLVGTTIAVFRTNGSP